MSEKPQADDAPVVGVIPMVAVRIAATDQVQFTNILHIDHEALDRAFTVQETTFQIDFSPLPVVDWKVRFARGTRCKVSRKPANRKVYRWSKWLTLAVLG